VIEPAPIQSYNGEHVESMDAAASFEFPMPEVRYTPGIGWSENMAESVAEFTILSLNTVPPRS
jgi:hypothetical protein